MMVRTGSRSGRATATVRSHSVVLLVLAAVVLGACSSESQTCKDLKQLNDSVTALKEVNVTNDGVSTLQTQFAAVESDLATFKSSASQDVAPAVGVMEASVQALSVAVQAAVSSPDATTIAAATAAIGAVGTSFTALQTAVPDC